MKNVPANMKEWFFTDWAVSPIRAVRNFLFRLGIKFIVPEILNEAGEFDTIIATLAFDRACTIIVSPGKDRSNPDPWIGVWRRIDDLEKPAKLSSETFLYYFRKDSLAQCTYDEKIHLAMEALCNVESFGVNNFVRVDGKIHYP